MRDQQTMPRRLIARQRVGAAPGASGLGTLEPGVAIARCGHPRSRGLLIQGLLGVGLLAAASLAQAANEVDAAAAPTSAPTSASPSAAPRFQIEASVTHDDNLTRGRSAAAKRSDQAYAVQLSRDASFTISPTTRLTLSGSVGGEAFGRYDKLGRVFGEGQAAVEYRASGGFSAPTFGLFARATGDAYRSTLRSGHRYAVGATVGAALTDRINVLGTLAYDGRHARSAVFTGRSRSARLNLDYAVSETDTVYLAGDYRRGDTTATGLASLENIDVAKVFVADDAFAADKFVSYRIEARTLVAVLGYNHGFSPRASLDLSWRHAVATPTLALPFATDVPNRYVANQLALSVLWRF